ncbi:MAG: DoxX family membrane protein, partial [Xanthomonadales bacterium]|nr:DoxX family membrane protein [Xanthomonadales bacterium]
MNTQTLADAPNATASNLTSTLVPLVGRGMISAIFLLSGLSKIAAPAMTIGYIQSVGLPMPSVAFGLSVFLELAGGLALLLGYRTRAVAVALALFSPVTAAVF